MDEPIYQIKPLRWKRHFNNYSQTYEANAAHGGYRVTRHRNECEEHENCNEDSHGGWQSWRWEYCFCEYYDESTIECATVKAGKAAAEDHWREYLAAGLIEVKGKSND